MAKLISKKQVCEKLSLSRAQIDRYTNDPSYRHIGFPKPVRLGQGRVAWVESEIDDWIAKRINDRDSS